MTRSFSTGGVLLALCATLAGCSSRTNVSATGSTPSQYTHLYITAQAVWFNTNANAGPDDSGWAKFVLKTPVTVDLVTDSNGSLGEIANDLRLAPGTYNSILLLPVDYSAALTTSAQSLGASFNEEVDYVDSTGSHQVALVLPNPEKGIIVPEGSLTVPVGKAGVPSASSTSSSTNTTNTTTNLFGTTTTTPATSTTGTTTGSNKTTTVSFATSFDTNRDLHMFTYNSGGTQTGVLLSANPTASDLATAGGISGTLTLTSLTNITGPSDRVTIQASAETLSPDGTHHVIVASAPVQTDGTFTIYPLPSNSSTPTVYDVVIHGPNIATIIIKSVSVTTSAPTITSAATSTGGSTQTTTVSSAVSLGTFIPRSATSFTTPTSLATLPPGAAVTFYQTLPASGEVPYAIDEVGIDPFNFNLTNAEALSPATIDTGTYTSSGTTITVTSATPTEGAGVYRVGATAPLFNDGSLSSSTEVSSTSTQVPVPTLSPTSGTTASITATVTEASGQYDQGELIVSHNGAVVGTASLNSVLPAGGSVTVSGLPGGSSALYYLSVIVWNSTGSSNPTGPAFVHQSMPSPVDLSSGSATGVTVAIN